MILDRLPITYAARTMTGHRRMIDIPAYRRPPVGKPQPETSK